MSETALTASSLRHDADKESTDLPGLMVLAERAVQSIMSGQHRQRKAGGGERFWQFRPYDISDRPQDIDWRQSAKGDQVFVREKELQNAQNVVFWCAQGPRMDFTSAKHLPKKDISAKVLTLALAILATRSHEKISLLGGDARPGRTEKTLQLFGETLIDADTQNLNDIHFINAPKNSSLVLISDFLDPIEEIEKTCQALADAGDSGFMLQVLDPAELTLPYDGRMIFQDPENAGKEVIDNVTSIQSLYQARIQKHIESLQKICRSHGWNHVLHQTDTDISQTLFDVWMAMVPDQFALEGSSS